MYHALSFKYCKNEAGSLPDLGWFNQYTELAKTISHPKLQILWALALKQEIMNPASISLSTLKVLKSIGPREAPALQHAAKVGCSIGHDNIKKYLLSLQFHQKYWYFLTKVTTSLFYTHRC